MFPKALILIVEDEPLTALDIAATIRDTGGGVLGPAGSVSEALDLLRADPVDGAILACHLRDGEITPRNGSGSSTRTALGQEAGDRCPQGRNPVAGPARPRQDVGIDSNTQALAANQGRLSRAALSAIEARDHWMTWMTRR